MRDITNTPNHINSDKSAETRARTAQQGTVSSMNTTTDTPKVYLGDLDNLSRIERREAMRANDKWIGKLYAAADGLLPKAVLLKARELGGWIDVPYAYHIIELNEGRIKAEAAGRKYDKIDRYFKTIGQAVAEGAHDYDTVRAWAEANNKTVPTHNSVAAYIGGVLNELSAGRVYDSESDYDGEVIEAGVDFESGVDNSTDIEDLDALLDDLGMTGNQREVLRLVGLGLDTDSDDFSPADYLGISKSNLAAIKSRALAKARNTAN